MAVSHKERAYSHIREKMLAGDLKAGAKLSEVTLAKEIGMSRTPVREAMNQLEVEGLIEQVPRYGAFVRKLERRELEELYDLRALLEGFAASRAAQRIAPEQLEELQQLCDHTHDLVGQFRDARQPALGGDLARQFVMSDVAFHMLLVRASGSQRVGKIVSDFRILTHICGHNRNNPRQSLLLGMARTWAEHARIVKALRKRDSEGARGLVEAHIVRAKVGALANFDLAGRMDGSASAGDWPASIRKIISEMERI